MKTINSLAELQIGVGLVYLKDGNAEYYEVIMHHPVQTRTFVLMRKPDMKLIRVHTETLMGSSAWLIDFSQKGALTDVLSLIDTLEVKEVDLENIAAVEWDNYIRKINGEPDNAYMLINRNSYIWLAKHFFELGMQSAQKL